MQLYISKTSFAIAGCTARRWKPYGSQLQNGIFKSHDDII